MICVLWMPLRMPWVRTPETYWRVRIEWLRVSPSVPRERDNHCENYAVSPIEHQIHCANAVVETHTRNRQRTDMHAHVKRRVPAVKIVHMRRSCAYSLVHGNPGHQPKIEKLIFDTVATMCGAYSLLDRTIYYYLFIVVEISGCDFSALFLSRIASQCEWRWPAVCALLFYMQFDLLLPIRQSRRTQIWEIRKQTDIIYVCCTLNCIHDWSDWKTTELWS